MGQDDMEISEKRIIRYGHRKVFKHGQFSHAIVIPSGFVRDNDIQAGDELRIVSEGGGTITVKKEMK